MKSEMINAIVSGVNCVISHFFTRREQHVVFVTNYAQENLDFVFDKLIEKAPQYAISVVKAVQEVEKAMEELDPPMEDSTHPIADLGAEA